jgi:hypothetical protein
VDEVVPLVQDLFGAGVLLCRLGDCEHVEFGLVLRQHILIAKLTQTVVQIFSLTTYGWAGCHTVWGILHLLAGWWR